MPHIVEQFSLLNKLAVIFYSSNQSFNSRNVTKLNESQIN